MRELRELEESEIIGELKEIILKNEQILSSFEFEDDYVSIVYQRLFKDIVEKSRSILVLKEAGLTIGIPSITRSIIESYVYMKYIFDDNYTNSSRAEAYYLKGLLDEIVFFDNFNKDKDLLNFFGITSIKPLYKDGREHHEVFSEMLKRYGKLTNEEITDPSYIPKFYSNGKYKDRRGEYKYINNSFSKLCRHMDEGILYKVFYNVLSSEVHSTTNEMEQYIIDHIIILCIDINRFIQKYLE